MNCDSTAGAHGLKQFAADLPGTRIVHDTDTDVLGARAQLRNAGNRSSRSTLEGNKRLRASRPQEKRIARLDDAPRHRCTLTAQPYETHDGHGASPR
jgi:hypothetical protein